MSATDENQPSAPDELPEELRELVKPELAPDERLLWAGRRVRLPPTTGLRPVVGIAWSVSLFVLCGLSLAVIPRVFGPRFGNNKDPEVLVFVVGFASGVVGLFVALATFGGWYSRGASRGQVGRGLYALTDRRAIIWNPQKGSDAIEVYSYPCSKIRYVHRVEYPDGSGDVKFRFADESVYWGLTSFEGIADVRRVEDLVRMTTHCEPGPVPERLEAPDSLL